MQQIKFRDSFVLFLFLLLFNVLQSSAASALCPGTPSCNCTLTNNTYLDIVCSSTLNLTVLPVFNDVTLQSGVTEIHVSSSTIGTHGPLTSLPTNICSSYPNVAVLDLSWNSITGSLNMSQLNCLGTKLTYLDFSNNYISDTDLNFLRVNSLMQSINLAQNVLTKMPAVNSDTFVNFPTTFVLMNFSYNQITNVDLWPLFVKNQNSMIIDMSYNVIQNYTNEVPIYVNQFTATADPRSFYLNNNQIEGIPDILLQQYGACPTISTTSTAYFLVAVSNMLLINNNLTCNCDSYNFIQFIENYKDDFPQLTSGTALITRAMCSTPDSMVGQQYIFSNFSAGGACASYTLPSQTNIFCSVYPNDTAVTIAPPTYWTPTTTIATTLVNPNATTISSGGNGPSGNSGTNGSSSLSSPAWYIILGVVLGLALIVFLLVIAGYIYRDRLFPLKYGSKLSNNGSSHRHSDASDYHGMHSGRWNHPEQETQTCFQIDRTKPPRGVKRDLKQLRKAPSLYSSDHDRTLSTSVATDAGTNTTSVVKGIPIPAKVNKIPSIPSANNGTVPSTSASELNVTAIPLAPSKRAKLLPQVKSGIYVDTINNNLLNTSASAFVSNQRQRRRSSMWVRRQQQNSITPIPSRPHSVTARKTVFDHEDTYSDDISSIPTVEALSSRPPKPLRALPLLNITVIPGWIDNNSDQN
ncbi:unnamed protein product [Rotaria socialis]|uniref:Uncharacterized protein n=1 Tax=Rotaria socialis TaxID=392032 RepID=A0A821LZZ9_9BILA|nr:unnamed protein product [Rotaria socialis]